MGVIISILFNFIIYISRYYVKCWGCSVWAGMPAAPNTKVKQQEDCNDKAGAN